MAPAAVLLILDIAVVLKRIVDVTKSHEPLPEASQRDDFVDDGGGIVLTSGNRMQAARGGYLVGGSYGGYSPLTRVADEVQREEGGGECTTRSATLQSAVANHMNTTAEEDIFPGGQQAAREGTSLTRTASVGRIVEEGLARASPPSGEMQEGDVRRRYVPFSMEPCPPPRSPADQQTTVEQQGSGSIPAGWVSASRKGRRRMPQWFTLVLLGLEAVLDAAAVIQVRAVVWGV